MITKPNAIRVLCFGDSNTYGMPADADGWSGPVLRWPVDVRWTGRMQRILGNGYDVIEEGHCGRTVEMPDPLIAGADGRAYLVPCLQTHNPIDVVVLMIGTNDTKSRFGRDAERIAASIGRLVDDVETYAADHDGRTPTVLLVAPAPVELRPGMAEFDDGSVREAQRLSPLLRKLAADRGAAFADAGTVGRVGADGIHLTHDSHTPIGELLAGVVAGLR